MLIGFILGKEIILYSAWKLNEDFNISGDLFTNWTWCELKRKESRR